MPDAAAPLSPFPAPAFGEPVPQAADTAVLAYLARRRSASAPGLGAPGPDADQLRGLLTLAARVPDHGKLFPWRFIIVEGEAKAALARDLSALAAVRPDAAKAQAALLKLTAPPVAVAVISRPVPGKIPEWEQALSAGAVCMTLLTAAGAMGFGANWITDWYAYDPQALERLGVSPGEAVAGFIYIGTPGEAPLERVRPDLDALITRL